MTDIKVRINIPTLPDGYEISVSDLPVPLLNNEDVEVSEEAILQYEKATGLKFEHLLQGKKFGGPGRPKPKKKDELEAMNKNELVNLAKQTGVEVSTHDTKTEIVDALTDPEPVVEEDGVEV